MSDGEDSEDDGDDASMGSFIDDNEEDGGTRVDHRLCDLELAEDERHDNKKRKRAHPEVAEDDGKKTKKRANEARGTPRALYLSTQSATEEN